MSKKSRLHEVAKMVIAELEAEGDIVGKTAGPWHLMAVNRWFGFTRFYRFTFNGPLRKSDLQALEADVGNCELAFAQFWVYTFTDGHPKPERQRIEIDRRKYKKRSRRLNPGWDDDGDRVSGSQTPAPVDNS